MNINLKTLSPVHIGSGEDISPMEYFLNDEFVRIDMNSLFNDPEFESIIDKFVQSAGGVRYIGDQVPHSLLTKHSLYSIGIKGSATDYLRSNQTNVKSFIKSGGRVYIPGSTLKGCILSALIWFVLREATGKDRSEIVGLMQKKVTKHRDYNEFINIAFKNMIKNMRGNFRFNRWIDVSDSDLKTGSEVLEISLARIKGAKTGGEQPILYETLKIASEFNIKITTKNLKFSEKQVLEICNKFYSRVFQKDKSENIQTTANLLRLGQGSSAFSTSLLILCEDLNIERYKVSPPKTKKRIDDHFAMGWVELSNS